jgi:pyridoxal phosphate enzyme (YggS family)
MNIISNFLNIRSRVSALNNKSKIIVVSKNQTVDKIMQIINKGHYDFAENKVQEALNKWPQILIDNQQINLHLIGKLQSNKVNEAYKIFNYIHSLDNEKIAKKFSQLHIISPKNIKYFIQVNIGNEIQKNGIEPSQLQNFVRYCSDDLMLNIVGLMCIPPIEGDPNQYFNNLAQLAKLSNLNELSMGMSNDYESAIRNGATFVRIGSKIFSEH